MKWIDITIESPEILEDIIFWHPNNTKVMLGKVMPDGIHSSGHRFNITHWMPLPEPPKQ